MKFHRKIKAKWMSSFRSVRFWVVREFFYVNILSSQWVGMRAAFGTLYHARHMIYSIYVYKHLHNAVWMCGWNCTRFSERMKGKKETLDSALYSLSDCYCFHCLFRIFSSWSSLHSFLTYALVMYVSHRHTHTDTHTRHLIINQNAKCIRMKKKQTRFGFQHTFRNGLNIETFFVSFSNIHRSIVVVTYVLRRYRLWYGQTRAPIMLSILWIQMFNSRFSSICWLLLSTF